MYQIPLSIFSSAFLSKKAFLVYGILFLALSYAGGFVYIKHLRNKVAMLKANNEVFVSLLQEQSSTIDKLQKDYSKIILINQDLISKERTYEKRVVTLNEKFTKNERDFGKLAIAKPITIQRAIIKGTREKFIEIEILTGWKQQ